jgi:hypothetical protein
VPDVVDRKHYAGDDDTLVIDEGRAQHQVELVVKQTMTQPVGLQHGDEHQHSIELDELGAHELLQGMTTAPWNVGSLM